MFFFFVHRPLLHVGIGTFDRIILFGDADIYYSDGRKNTTCSRKTGGSAMRRGGAAGVQSKSYDARVFYYYPREAKQ